MRYLLILTLAGCGAATGANVSDFDIATYKAVVAITAETLDSASPDKPLRKDCTVCKGTGKVQSGDGLHVFDCTNCVAPTATATVYDCHCGVTGVCDCGDDCQCLDCPKHFTMPAEPTDGDPLKADLFHTGRGLWVMGETDNEIRIARLLLRALERIEELTSPHQEPSEPEVSTPTDSDTSLTVGRNPRLLLFSTDPENPSFDCAACVIVHNDVLPWLKASGWTIGPGPENQIQIMPDDLQVRAEYGVTLVPTFIRLDNGRMSHIYSGTDRRRIVETAYGDTEVEWPAPKRQEPPQTFQQPILFRGAYQPRFMPAGC